MGPCAPLTCMSASRQPFMSMPICKQHLPLNGCARLYVSIHCPVYRGRYAAPTLEWLCQAVCQGQYAAPTRSLAQPIISPYS
ncbi:unnamed protein product [Staurois parvus]|uniref:Uncharacterized protein n=1 Tax=Staurois parvus TaxID=386267 RepID=A0ABN9D8S2_9NEOB|nr:unnamed protein product [Staurois parvus]